MKLSKEHVFLVKFFAVFAAVEFLIFYLDFSFIEDFIASSQADFFGLESLENLVFVRDGAFEITSSCTGLVSGSVLAAIIFSLRRPQLREKAAIFLAGFTLLLALNYLRVMAVIWVGIGYGVEAAEVAHVASWLTTSAFIIALWYAFTKKITGVNDFSGFL